MTPHTHIIENLRWLNRILTAHILRLRRSKFYTNFNNFQGFFIADEEIDALLATGIFEERQDKSESEIELLIDKLRQEAQEIWTIIDKRVKESQEKNISLPLARLTEIFHLSEFEQKVLILCIAPQIDARYEKLYAYLQNDLTKKFPSVDLILGLLFQNIEERLQFLSLFQPTAPLLHYRLIENVEVASTDPRFLRADPRIVQYVIGNQSVDCRLVKYIQFLPSHTWSNVIVSEELKNRLKRLLTIIIDRNASQRSAIYLFGRNGVGKKSIARAMCSEIEVPLAVVDAGSLIGSPGDFIERVRLILREALLQPCGVYFDKIEKLGKSEEYTTILTRLVQEIKDMGWFTFLGSKNHPTAIFLDTLPVYTIEIPAPGHNAQKRLWGLHLNRILTDKQKLNYEQLTAHFDLTGGQISRAVNFSKQNAVVCDSKNGKVTIADLMKSCRLQSQIELTRLVQMIKPIYTWEDIVLPEDTIAQLHEICQRVIHRHKVLSKWGFDRKLSLGKGVNALFAGPTGTGKTMAAEVIATELGLELYKIDLSGVVSKYIGETEKNLNSIFEAAEHSNSILFFDEADALFGKRSEVRDSHDRYANIEISYLLQKMEQYEGLTILATNLKGNLDEAFTRRLAFTIHFPFPDEASRLLIWNRIWPSEIPLAKDIDLNLIASNFKLNGGNIKNIALTTAFLSAENGDLVTMAHMFQAIKREYQNMGKKLILDELGQCVE